MALLGNTLREYGKNYPLIQKSVGTEYSEVFNGKDCFQSTVRYYIDNKIYKLDKQYSLDESLPPRIPKKDAHLVIGLDPHQTLAILEYISEKSFIVLNSHISNQKNSQSVGKIIDLLDQLARDTISMDFNKLAKVIYANIDMSLYIVLGLVTKEFKDLIRKKYILDQLQCLENNSKIKIEAFELGYSLV